MDQRILFILLFPLIGLAQAPNKINFQSVIRNNLGEVQSNKSVSLRVSILSNSINGTAVFSESHTKTTDANGLISLQIGNGTVLSGVFANIDWGSSPHFIKLEADFSGGSNFVLLGSQELMSVPYALYATKTDTSSLNLVNRLNAKVGISDTANMLSNYRTGLNDKVNISDTSKMLTNYRNSINNKLNISDFPLGTTPGNMQYWNGTTWVNLSPGLPGQSLIITATGIPIWSGAAQATLTTAFYSITPTSAYIVGSITADGGASVSSRGFVYGTSSNPTLSNTVLYKGSGGGAFNGTLTGLTPNTTYYVRAYATNSSGTGYGNEVTFQTPPNYVPELITTNLSGVTQTTFTSGGTITNDGGSAIIARGIVYGTSSNPTLSSNTVLTLGSGTGSFIGNVTGLSPNTVYFVRAYATNSVGTGYGEEVLFGGNSLILSIKDTTVEKGATFCSNVTVTNFTDILAAQIYFKYDTRKLIFNKVQGLNSALKIDINSNFGNVLSADKKSARLIFSWVDDQLKGVTLPVASTLFQVCFTAVNADAQDTLKTDIIEFISPSYEVVSSIVNSPVITIGTGNSLITDINQSLNLKVNIADTASMLANYRIGLNQKVNIADTASMLNPYLRKADTIGSVETDPVFNSSFAKGITGIDTAYWNRKLNLSDTSNMLSNYRTGLNNKLNILDTTNLSNRINTKLNISDFPLGTTLGNMHYWNGTTWVNLSPGLPGQSLIISSTGIPSWSGAAIPTVITDSVSEISILSALVSGNVINDGGETITERGFFYNINDNPTLSDGKYSSGSGIGTFSETIGTSGDRFGLKPNTTYYVRAFATNRIGTGYGNTVIFSTNNYSGQLPIFQIVILDGQVNDKIADALTKLIHEGNGIIKEVGFVFSKFPNPTINDSKTLITNYQGGIRLNRISYNLDQSTKYYVRVYAINDYGISYSNEVQFITKFRPDLVEDFDGNIYGLLQIGNQIWMNENLKVSHFRNGAEIPKIEDDNSWSNLSSAAWSNYNNLKQSPYGKLYNWYSTIGDSICPIGWHVPSNEDFSNLINFLGGNEKAKEFLNTPPSSSWHLNETTNNFNAFPAGFRSSNGSFAGINQIVNYWSKTETSINNAVMLYLQKSSLSLSDLSFVPGYTKNLGSYIRCLKNN